MREAMLVAFPNHPELSIALSSAFAMVVLRCEHLLHQMNQRWNPRVAISNKARWLDDFEDATLRGNFRFDRGHIRELIHLLEIPEQLRSSTCGRVFNGEEAFLLLLRRLAGRETLTHLATIFDRSPPALSEMYNVILRHVYTFAKVSMQLELWEDELPAFAHALREHGCPLPHCCGFIDGTMFDICRPIIDQESMYNGWKRGHKTKYQCVVLPNFLIGDWHGPASGRTNDSVMLDDSRLIPRLQGMRDRFGSTLYMYGDSAYPECDVLLRAPKGNRITRPERMLARDMSRYRESVEWVFGKLGNIWPFITDKSRKVTGSRATGMEDWVAAMLTNFHTCAYGGVANRFFEMRPPSMSEYKSKFAAHLHISSASEP